MPSERRLGPRRQLALDVMLEHSRLGLRRYQTRDVSLDGVFIHKLDESTYTALVDLLYGRER